MGAEAEWVQLEPNWFGAQENYPEGTAGQGVGGQWVGISFQVNACSVLSAFGPWSWECNLGLP